MSQTVLIATAPGGTDGDSAGRLRLDVDLDARWAAGKREAGSTTVRCVAHLSLLAPAVVIAAAIVCLLLIR
jgi:hypothetical protein